MKKTHIIVFLVILLFEHLFLISFSISSGEYHHFPYGKIPHNFIYELFQRKKHPKIVYLEELKNQEIKLIKQRKEVEFSNLDSIRVYLTYGQSNSVNRGQFGYHVKNDVFEFYDNKIYKYQDPTIGGGITSNGGTVWGMLGDLIIDNSNLNKVIFSISGKGGQTIKQLSEGDNYNLFIKNYNSLKSKFGKVDGVLFHQGESNNFRLSGNKDYYENFVSFLNKMKKDGVDTPIFLSRVSHINFGDDKGLIDIQNKIIKDFPQVKKGPNTDKFNLKEDRLPDGTHFSLLGYEKFSKEWIQYLLEKK